MLPGMTNVCMRNVVYDVLIQHAVHNFSSEIGTITRNLTVSDLEVYEGKGYPTHFMRDCSHAW